MKFGYLTYALHRSPAGIGTYTRELLSSLRFTDLNPKIFNAGETDYSKDSINLPGSGILPGLLTLGQVDIGWKANKLNLDLFHDPTGTAPLLFTHSSRVVTICDAFPFVQPHSSALLERVIYRYWLPRILPRIDSVITISQQSKSDIIHHLPLKSEKITVTPLAAGAKFRPVPSTENEPILAQHEVESPYILYVGSIEPRKNLVRLLEAYALLRDWSEEWGLVIVGARNFWKSTPVAEKVKQLKLEDCVHFTGYVPDKDLPVLYSAADLFVFPSLYEGFGLPVLEAMACGTPVVTSNSTSLPEVAGEAALLVDPYDVEAIAEAMMRVLSDPELAADLRQRGLARAKQFTWEKTARETIKVYERVLGRQILKPE